MNPSAQQLAETIIYRYITLSRYQHYLSHYLRREYNISGQQLSVLWRLVESGPCSVGEISQFLHIRDGTTSPLLDRMEEAGYIRRRRCHEDARRVMVEPTDLGREKLDTTPMGVVMRLRKMLPEVAVEDLERIDQALQKLSEIAEVDESLLD
jgi:DNA-binding MarR family transcriptional regulator